MNSNEMQTIQGIRQELKRIADALEKIAATGEEKPRSGKTW